ncbi:unnamed protein product, partial [Callosobruchus maculatus]
MATLSAGSRNLKNADGASAIADQHRTYVHQYRHARHASA